MVKCAILTLLLTTTIFAGSPAPDQFRGYYMTFMRMPLWGLPQWKDAIDCFEQDRVNTLILWTAGGFRSEKFPITWKYNQEHKNVEKDFTRELIDYAHAKKIHVLLGFTPFGYDGVNQYPIEHPELKAKKRDGTPVDEFGIHSWGWSLCPSKAESQMFMLEYVRELAFDFYPNADGLMIESSDYNICRCSDCGTHYYAREFSFVRKISEEVWNRNASATILVYPHYFSGKKVNQGSAIESEAEHFPLDRRWTLLFTPHSAHLESNLVVQAGSSIYSNDALSLRTPAFVQEGVQKLHSYKLTGYMPSLEPFSYIMPRPEFGEGAKGQRIKPLGFDWVPDGQMVLRELPARVIRFTYREYMNNPLLTEAEFRVKVGEEFFNSKTNSQAVDDLLFLQSCINLDRNWTAPSPLVDPKLFQARIQDPQWKNDPASEYSRRLRRFQEIATRHQSASSENAREMNKIAAFILKRWEAAGLLKND